MIAIAKWVFAPRYNTVDVPAIALAALMLSGSGNGNYVVAALVIAGFALVSLIGRHAIERGAWRAA